MAERRISAEALARSAMWLRGNGILGPALRAVERAAEAGGMVIEADGARESGGAATQIAIQLAIQPNDCVEWEGRLDRAIRTLSGPENARSIKSLSDIVSRSEREVIERIYHLRLYHQVPICNTQDQAFFFPQTLSQTIDTVRGLRAIVEAKRALLCAMESGVDAEFGGDATPASWLDV